MTKGFTLIELLVVVLIIGILAAVALPQYQVAVLKSRYVQLMTFGNAIENASNVYYMENGTYPRRFDELSVDLPGTGNGYRKAYQDYACELTDQTMNQSDGIYCTMIHNTNRLSYRLVFGYKWRCMATKTWEQGNKVCQNLTGKKTPNSYYGDSGSATEQAVYHFD